MRKKVLLVTAIGGDVACAALRCLKELRHDFYIVGIDCNTYNQGKLYVDEFYVAPPYSMLDKYKSFLLKVITQKKVDYFFPISEPEIEIAYTVKSFLDQNSVKLLALREDIFEIFISKYKTYHFCKNLGMDVPETLLLSDYNTHVGSWIDYPMIIKRDKSCAEKNFYIANTQQDLRSILDSVDKARDLWIAQEYIGNIDDEYTVCVFSDGTKDDHICFKRKLGINSMTVKVETVASEEICEITKTISNAISLVGSLNIQLRKQNGKYYIFEINPRVSSSCGFRHKCGFKDVVWWIQLISKMPYDFSYTRKSGIKGIKAFDDIIFDENGEPCV